MAVSACSPPDSSESVAGFLPGGLARMSRPASSGSSLSTSCNSAVPPPNSEVNRRWKWPFTTSKEDSSRSRASLFRLWMPWRSRLIASVRSSRSVTRLVCWVSTSFSSSSARRLTAPSRSRSRRSLSSRSSTSSTGGNWASDVISARPATCEGSHSSISRISCAMSPVRRVAGSGRPSPRPPFLRAPPPSFRARRLRARLAHCFERDARSLVGLGERRLGAGAAVGSVTPSGLGLVDFREQRAALLAERRRRAFERLALGFCVGQPLGQRGDLRDRAVPAAVPFGAFGRDRGQAPGAQFGLAGERLRFAARLGEHGALGRDLATRFRQPVLELVHGCKRCDALARLLPRALRLITAGD